MSWGTHPDTMCMATASNMADALHTDRNSVEWLKAYRDAYHSRFGNEDRVGNYIAELDAELKAKRRTQ